MEHILEMERLGFAEIHSLSIQELFNRYRWIRDHRSGSYPIEIQMRLRQWEVMFLWEIQAKMLQLESDLEVLKREHERLEKEYAHVCHQLEEVS